MLFQGGKLFNQSVQIWDQRSQPQVWAVQRFQPYKTSGWQEDAALAYEMASVKEVRGATRPSEGARAQVSGPVDFEARDVVCPIRSRFNPRTLDPKEGGMRGGGADATHRSWTGLEA